MVYILYRITWKTTAFFWNCCSHVLCTRHSHNWCCSRIKVNHRRPCPLILFIQYFCLRYQYLQRKYFVRGMLNYGIDWFNILCGLLHQMALSFPYLLIFFCPSNASQPQIKSNYNYNRIQWLAFYIVGRLENCIVFYRHLHKHNYDLWWSS